MMNSYSYAARVHARLNQFRRTAVITMTVSIMRVSGDSEDDSLDQLIVTQSLAPAVRRAFQVIIGLDHNDGAPHHS
jgi:hypothetical protein